MRVAVDMDEVLYSWERTARYLLRNEYYGDPHPVVVDTPFTEWSLGIDERAYKWLFDEGIELGLFRHGHVITGRCVGLGRSRRLGMSWSS